MYRRAQALGQARWTEAAEGGRGEAPSAPGSVRAALRAAGRELKALGRRSARARRRREWRAVVERESEGARREWRRQSGPAIADRLAPFTSCHLLPVDAGYLAFSDGTLVQARERALAVCLPVAAPYECGLSVLGLDLTRYAYRLVAVDPSDAELRRLASDGSARGPRRARRADGRR